MPSTRVGMMWKREKGEGDGRRKVYL